MIFNNETLYQAVKEWLDNPEEGVNTSDYDAVLGYLKKSYSQGHHK